MKTKVLTNKETVDLVRKVVSRWGQGVLPAIDAMGMIESLVSEIEIGRRDLPKFRSLLKKLV